MGFGSELKRKVQKLTQRGKVKLGGANKDTSKATSAVASITEPDNGDATGDATASSSSQAQPPAQELQKSRPPHDGDIHVDIPIPPKPTELASLEASEEEVDVATPVADTSSLSITEPDNVPATEKSSLWNEAYKNILADPELSPLVKDYQRFLEGDIGQNGNKGKSPELAESVESTAQFERLQGLARDKLEKLSKSQLAFSIGEKRIVVREHVRKLVKVLVAFKGLIGTALEAEPPLLWRGLVSWSFFHS
ncbi:hypothetical protein B0T17DRAFT_382067 [Bombardia bombarda]|uniref:NWD NACHT-NTPase N-terminal domain-containing protein n=1 Tax=Bombardia bombarda TaxID=252184 RepID=A0AA40BVM0_9PEZI|nr:hypothetical protein B0T17DRAFT_382067 [Bombardia bombarda]